MKLTNKTTGFAFLITYLIVRIIPDSIFWRNISEYYGYAFEALFVSAGIFVFNSKNLFKRIPAGLSIALLSLSLASGYCIYKLAFLSGMPIPVDFSGLETAFLVLLLAPVLEELIFRMTIWDSITRLQNKTAYILVSSSVLFALGHMQAFWFVPDDFKPFILYQSLYVILLGLACGWARLATGSITAPILIHAGFNLGFYVAAKMTLTQAVQSV